MKLVGKGRKNGSGGFTLVELIVVLVILGILAAIMVPALLGWIDKARNQDAILECRNVVMAAQAQVAEEYGRKSVSIAEMENIINSEESVEKILKVAAADNGGAGIRNRSIRLDEHMILTDLVYTTGKNIRVIYDRNYNPVYRIDDGGKYTADVPGYHAQTVDIKPEKWDETHFLENDKKLKEEYAKYFSSVTNIGEMKNNSSKRLQIAYLEQYGEFPEVAWEQIHLPAGVKTPEDKAVWKPIVTKEGSVIMVADTKNEVGNALAAVIYCDGKYYYHEGYSSGSITKASIGDKDFSIDNLQNDAKWIEFSN